MRNVFNVSEGKFNAFWDVGKTDSAVEEVFDGDFVGGVDNTTC